MRQLQTVGFLSAVIIVLTIAWIWPSDLPDNVPLAVSNTKTSSLKAQKRANHRLPASVEFSHKDYLAKPNESMRETNTQESPNTSTEKTHGSATSVVTGETDSEIDESHSTEALAQAPQSDETSISDESDLDYVMNGTSTFRNWTDPPKSENPKQTSETANSGASKPLVCSSSLAVGSYDGPQEVTLDCSSNANISFCVSEGSCCDPSATGTNYSAPIIIGQEEKSYCLAVLGVAKNGTSYQREFTYSFSRNTTIEASIGKTQLQTSELPYPLFLNSDGLERVGFEFSVLNLFTHDVSPSGLNWNCSEIYANYSTLSSPSVTLPLAPVAGNSISGVPMAIELRKGDLAIGENQLVSFVVNRNYATQSFGCQTTDIKLEDFPYFDAYPSHGYSGSNDNREFSAGFTPYGAFGNQTQVSRGPASKHYDSVGPQELRSGFFAIFH